MDLNRFIPFTTVRELREAIDEIEKDPDFAGVSDSSVEYLDGIYGGFTASFFEWEAGKKEFFFCLVPKETIEAYESRRFPRGDGGSD